MKKGSKEAKAWGRKMKRLRGKTTTKRKVKYVYVKKKKRRASSMARRKTTRRTRRRATSPFSKLTKKKTLMYIGAASLFGGMIAPSIDPKIKAAAAGYMSGAGAVGAIGGYLAQPYISNMLGGILGGATGGTSAKMVFN